MSRNKLFERLKGYRNLPEGFYHLTFDSIEDGQLFHTDAEFSQGMNSVALGQLKHKLTIIVFNWMINHGHFLVKGTGAQCVDFFLYEKRRLNSMLVSGGHKTLDDDYGFKLVRIESEQQLEDTIIYICRNPYKAMQDITPTGYIWGTNYLIFSNLGKIISKVPVSELQSTMLRKILMTREVIPNNGETRFFSSHKINSMNLHPVIFLILHLLIFRNNFSISIVRFTSKNSDIMTIRN